MRILFLPASMIEVSARSLKERPLGGMETALIRLAQALAAHGHDVNVITSGDNPELSDPLYLPQRVIPHIGRVDVFISVREWTPQFLPVDARLRMFWTGDSYDLVQNTGIGDKRVVNKLDALLCVSGWHADRLCGESGFPREKAYVLRNGIELSDFAGSETRQRKRMIYSSTPFRGLKYLPEIFKALKPNHPQLELHVFSDYSVYASKPGKRDYHEGLQREFEQVAAELAAIDGCFAHGNVLQQQLAREMMRSSILAYPNTFEETSCITAMEAQAAGCVVLSSAHGALPETVGERGVLIKENPGSPEYLKSFIAQADRLLRDDAHWSRLSVAGLNAAKSFDWKVIAAEFSGYLKSRLE